MSLVMRIYFLAQRVPYPPDRGDKITTYNEVRYLAALHEVEVFCLADDLEDRDNVRGLSSIVAAVHAVPLSRVRATLRALAALLTKTPLTIAYFNERKLHRAIRQRLSEDQADVILVYSSGMAQFVEHLGDTPKIMQFAELDSLKWEQYSRMSTRHLRWIYRLEAKRLLKFERQIANRFSHSVVCTEREKEDFRKLIPGVRVSCIPNGVDVSYYSPGKLRKNNKSIIFTGVMNYYPNIDAVKWFCQDILPLVRREFPEIRFTICGSHPTPEVTNLCRLPGVTVTGRVPDVRPYLGAAELAAVPLRIGRGIQNKLLEAMAMGLPCVATTTAHTGIDAQHGKHLFVADEASDFASRVIRLLKNRELRSLMGARARDFVVAHHDWSVPLRKVETIVQQVANAER